MGAETREWIYCATDHAVDAEGTQQLLREHNAIWCPPPGIKAWPREHPRAGERLWLVWRPAVGDPAADPLLLGVGTLTANQQERFNTELLWTHTDLDDVRPAAENLGYRGGQGMSFLVLAGVQLPGDRPSIPLGRAVGTRFNEATTEQVAALEKGLG